MVVKSRRISPSVCGTAVIILMLFLNILGSVLAQDNVQTDVVEVTAAVPREFPPYYGMDDRGRPEGFAIDIMKQIAAMSGLRINYLVLDSWSDVEDAVKNGRAVVIPNIGISEKRKAWLDYTDPVETFPISIFVREYTSDIKGVDDLAGRKVAAVRFNIGLDLLRERQDNGVKVLDDAGKALLELLAGHVDAAVYPGPVFLKLAREVGLENRIRVAGKPLKEIKRAMGVAKGNLALLNRLDQAVKSFVGTKEYEKVLNKWFGKPPPFWSTTRVVVVVVVIGLTLFLLMAGWRYYSLTQLNRRLSNSIAERKQAEEGLRESEEKHRTLFERMSQGAFYENADGTIVDVNPAALDMFGLTREEFMGKTSQSAAWHVIHEDGSPVVAADRPSTKAAKTGKPVRGQVEGVFNPRTRSFVWVETNATPQYRKSETSPHRVFVTLHDITDRKRAEDALRRFELLVTQSRDIILFVRCEDAHILEANEAATKAYGYDREQLLQMTIYQLRATETWEQIPDQLAAADKHGILFETLHCRSDGSKFPVEVNSRGETIGGVRALISVVRDISERKLAEAALADEAVRRRILVEQSRDGIVVLDHEGKVYEANQRYAEMLGYTPQEVRHLHVWDWDTQWTREELLEMVRSADATGDHFETRHRRKDGSVFDVEISTNGAVCSGQKLVFCVCRDITERKRAREELLASEQKFRSVFERSPVGIILTDSQSVVLDCNQYFLDIFGVPREKYIGINLLENIPEGPVRKNLIDSISDYETHYYEGPYTSILSGKKAFLSISSEKVAPDLVISIISDITERRLAEEEHRKLEERLQRAEKMEALGTLAGGVAHDLNNVLGIVVGYSELLLNDLDESSSARSDAREILVGGKRAAAIVQDLLTLARRGVSGRKVLNLNSIVSECVKTAEFSKILAYHPNIEIEADLEPDLLNVSGSSVHLEKSFINLIINACEAMPDGGVMSVKTANCYLDRPISGYDEVRQGDYVVLSVSDTGEGIPASNLKRIFEPFYTKKVMGRSGTGLGLAVVWGTVKDHLGYINVESEEGKGTIFTLYFPVARDEITPEQVPVSVFEYMGNGQSVLVVDDVKEQRELASSMLRRLNYNVLSVPSGEEAVEYLKGHAVDMMVLDMIMDPGMDGLDTYIKVLEIHPKQKAIIVSGFSETDRVAKAQALGAGAYVKKPYLMEKLGLAVRNELFKQT